MPLDKRSENRVYCKPVYNLGEASQEFLLLTYGPKHLDRTGQVWFLFGRTHFCDRTNFKGPGTWM